MKAIYIALITLFSIFLLGGVYVTQFSNTTWGGWKPPDASLKLNKAEQAWLFQNEFKYMCEFDYIGLDGIDQDSIIYITINYKDNSLLKKELNENIEQITENLATSFLNLNKRTQGHLQITYNFIHNYNRDIIITNIPPERSCIYDIKKKKIIPTQKHLIISKFEYFYFSNKEVFRNKIGLHSYFYISNQYNPDSFSKNYNIIQNSRFRGVDSCIHYITKIPQKTIVKNGEIDSYYHYIFHNEYCISSVITHKIYPKNKTFTYQQAFDKITTISPKRLKHSKKDKLHLLDSLKTNPLSYKNISYGVLVNFQADTTKIPWTITYETSLLDVKYYSNFVE